MSSFRHLNLNPYRKRTGDCVIRAIACAFDIGWVEASDLLYEVARSIGCEMSCLGCYTTLFSDMNLFEVDPEDASVGELADMYSDSIMLVRIEGHLTCTRYGDVVDIWDCRDEIVDRAWIVQ